MTLEECARQIERAREGFRVAGGWALYNMGHALEEAFAECDRHTKGGEGTTFREFLSQVGIGERQARSMREFYRKYQPLVEAQGQGEADFFATVGLPPTTLRRLLDFKDETRERVLKESPGERGHTEREVTARAREIEQRTPAGKAPDVEGRLLTEYRHYRAALSFLCGREVDGEDTKTLIDLALEKIEEKYERLLATPAIKLRGYHFVRDFFERLEEDAEEERHKLEESTHE